MSNLQQELAGLRKLQDVRVCQSVAADPDILFEIDIDPMLGVRPLILRIWTTPTLDHVSCWIEFDDWHRCNAAVGSRRIKRRILIMVVETAWPRCNPEMIV